jgi:hypothetical protein
VSRFAAAFTVSSFTVFSVAGAIGVAAARIIPARAQLAAACTVLCAALLLDAYSLRRKTWCPVTMRRQTPKDIHYQHGLRHAAVAWGLDTGLIFTTYRMSSISWALLGLALLGVAPWWTGLGYAAGFLAPLLVGCSLGPRWAGSEATTAVSQVLVRWPVVARATSVVALAVAATAAGMWLAF